MCSCFSLSLFLSSDSLSFHFLAAPSTTAAGFPESVSSVTWRAQRNSAALQESSRSFFLRSLLQFLFSIHCCPHLLFHWIFSRGPLCRVRAVDALHIQRTCMRRLFVLSRWYFSLFASLTGVGSENPTCTRYIGSDICVASLAIKTTIRCETQKTESVFNRWRPSVKHAGRRILFQTNSAG